jgi:hypothetical protein
MAKTKAQMAEAVAETPDETPVTEEPKPLKAHPSGLDPKARAWLRDQIDAWRDSAMHHTSFLEHLEALVKE